jgi:hypothetical protein
VEAASVESREVRVTGRKENLMNKFTTFLNSNLRKMFYFFSYRVTCTVTVTTSTSTRCTRVLQCHLGIEFKKCDCDFCPRLIEIEIYMYFFSA